METSERYGQVAPGTSSLTSMLDEGFKLKMKYNSLPQKDSPIVDHSNISEDDFKIISFIDNDLSIRSSSLEEFIISLGFYNDDLDKINQVIMLFKDHSNYSVRASIMTCLSHLVRRFGSLEEKFLLILKETVLFDLSQDVRGCAQDALDDYEWFIYLNKNQKDNL